MNIVPRSIPLLIAVPALALIGILYSNSRPMASTAAVSKPTLGKIADAKLQLIDRNLVFYTGRLAVAEDDPVRVVELANQWVRRGKLTGDGADFDAAMDLLNKGEKVVGRPQPVIPAAKAHTLWARHRFAECRSVAEKALKSFPEDEGLTALASDCAEYSGDTAAGAQGFRRLAEMHATVSVPWIGLAYHYEIAGDLERSMDLLNKALNAGYPKPLGEERQAYVHSVMGDVYAKQGDQKNAKLQYRWALNEQADYAQALNGLADVALWEGDDEEAQRLLTMLIEREAPKADYQIKLADLLDRQGHKEEAAAQRREAETFYEWSVATGYDGYLRPLTAMKLAEGNFQRAAELSQRDLDIRPTAESRVIHQNVLAQAKAAGKSVNEFALRRFVNRALHPVEKS